ncbi:hypothetical protein [Gorillibacterium timonense]|uniref:hypothetical protein n=1 Tax=Gorillibacterium timonense TaxID=1689269 RepID=UPI00071DA266|nr:hypothetical protein [Gorillibacterium timonense]
MKENNKFLAKLWIPIVLLIIFASIGLVREISEAWTYVLIPVIVLLFFYVIRVRVKNRVKAALQHQTPDKLIETIASPLRGSVRKELQEPFYVYNTALSYVFYGELDKAASVMNTIEWETKEPMFQALNDSIRSQIQYFTNDIHSGLANARRAKALAATSSFPGAKKSAEVYEAYVEVGEIVGWNRNDDLIRSLEQKYQKMPLLPKLIIAWGLMNGYHQRNETKKCEDMLEFCKSSAPHCKGLVKIVGRGTQDEINFN